MLECFRQYELALHMASKGIIVLVICSIMPHLTRTLNKTLISLYISPIRKLFIPSRTLSLIKMENISAYPESPAEHNSVCIVLPFGKKNNPVIIQIPLKLRLASGITNNNENWNALVWRGFTGHLRVFQIPSTFHNII